MLLQRFIVLAGEEPPSLVDIDLLCRPLCELARQMEEFSGQVMRDYVGGMQQAAVKKLAEGRTSNTHYSHYNTTPHFLFFVSCVSVVCVGSAWPSTRGLFFMQLLAHMYPVSDFVHTVLTPVTLMLGECLALSRIQTARDVAAALFTCNVFLQVCVYIGSCALFCSVVLCFCFVVVGMF